MSQPVKRGPGRPRKQPAAPPAAPVAEVVVEVPVDESDPRIGTLVRPEISHIGYEDGSMYRVDGGVVVERLI